MKRLTLSPQLWNKTKIEVRNQTISNGTSKSIAVGVSSDNENISPQAGPSSATIIGPPWLMANQITANRNDANSITVICTPQG
jgi:hypothetical protein